MAVLVGTVVKESVEGSSMDALDLQGAGGLQVIK